MTTSVEEQIKKELYKQRLGLADRDPVFVEEYRKLESMICGSLASGYEQLNAKRKSKNDTNEIGPILGWDFAPTREKDQIQITFMKDVVQLLNIPDFEKERKVYIEKGLNFLKKALSDERFYEDAFGFFLKALDFEDIDYYVLYNLGLVHLFSVNHFDLEKSKTYFQKAAKYGSIDVNFVKSKITDHSSSFELLISPRKLSTNALIYAARISFDLKDTRHALALIEQALQVSPKNTEVLFDKAIYALAQSQTGTCINALKEAIEADYFITLKILSNMKMMDKIEVRNTLIQLNDSLRSKTWEDFQKCKDMIHSDSQFHKQIRQIDLLLRENTFLATNAANDILNN